MTPSEITARLIEIYRDLPEEIRSLPAALDQFFRETEITEYVRTGTDAEQFATAIAEGARLIENARRVPFANILDGHTKDMSILHARIRDLESRQAGANEDAWVVIYPDGHWLLAPNRNAAMAATAQQDCRAERIQRLKSKRSLSEECKPSTV